MIEVWDFGFGISLGFVICDFLCKDIFIPNYIDLAIVTFHY